MKILSIDTANWPLSVAISDGESLIGEINTNISKNHSLRLMPAIEQLFLQTDLKRDDLDGIAVSFGPGSYTGVRIGVTTAKTMAWSLNVPIIGISSLQVMAQNRLDFPGLIVPMIDARRGQVYTGAYEYDTNLNIRSPLIEDQIVLADHFLEQLITHQEQLLFIGEGVNQHKEAITEKLGNQAHFARAVDHPPRARELAFLAFTLWKKQHTNMIHFFAPQYLQLAEAEAKWVAQQGCEGVK